MTRYAQIRDSKIANIFYVDESKVPFSVQYSPQFVAACVPCPDERVGEDWKWNGKEFSEPDPVVIPDLQPTIEERLTALEERIVVLGSKVTSERQSI